MKQQELRLGTQWALAGLGMPHRILDCVAKDPIDLAERGVVQLPYHYVANRIELARLSCAP